MAAAAQIEHLPGRRPLEEGPERFDDVAFEEAFTGFRRLYHVRPARVLCAPGVLTRYALLFSRSVDDAHAGHALRYDGVPLESAILEPGTIIFEGEVDEEQISKALQEMVSLTPRAIRTHLKLNRPIYARTSAYGHFGRAPEADGGFSWEKTDLAAGLRTKFGA